MLYPLFTRVYAQYYQARLMAVAEEYQNPALEYPVESSARGLERRMKAEKPPVKHMPDGAFMTIEIPALDLSAVVLEGTDRPTLNKGPGWYQESALPGEGNTAIAGHRNTYGAWFRHVDKLNEGDEIIIGYDSLGYTYKVERVFPIAKNDWSVIEPCGYPALTLTTCHPVGSARAAACCKSRFSGLGDRKKAAVGGSAAF
ncbi:MAG: class E sortase [Clostridia bacterium]